MKIGYLMQAGVPDLWRQPLSGPALHVTRIFRELAKLGEDVRMLVSSGGQLLISADLREFRPVRVRGIDDGFGRVFERVVRRVQTELRLPWMALFDSIRFSQACRQELADCDLFYERMGWMGYGGALASRQTRIPLILEVNGDHPSELRLAGVAPRGVQRRLSTALTRYAARRATHSIATGQGWRDRFVERWGVPLARTSVVENGTDMVDLLARERLRSFGPSRAPGEPVNVIYVGAFEPWHGIPTLVSALARVRSAGASVVVTLVGTGSCETEIRQMVSGLGLDACVSFCGACDQTITADHLSAADIAACPYMGRVEYSGLKILDYKGAGLPTIASGERGEPSLLRHRRTGWIVPPGDSGSLAEAMEALAGDPDLVREMGREARLEAEQQHTWRHSAQRLREVFRQVVEP